MNVKEKKREHTFLHTWLYKKKNRWMQGNKVETIESTQIITNFIKSVI